MEQKEQLVCVSQKDMLSHSQHNDLQDGHGDTVCARVDLEVRGLQKLQCPLKLIVRMNLSVCGHQEKDSVCYTVQELPFIAEKFKTL